MLALIYAGRASGSTQIRIPPARITRGTTTSTLLDSTAHFLSNTYTIFPSNRCQPVSNMSLRPLDTVSKTSSSALALASQREGGSSAESAALWISPVWVHLSPAPAFLPRREQPYFQAQGDLRISNDGLTFASLSSGEAKGLAGFALSPTAVALHALSSSLPDSLPKNLSSSALYIMIDEHPEKDDDDGEEDDEAGPTELWIALDLLEEGKVNVQGAFDALSEAVRSHSAPPAPEDDAKEEYEQEEEEGTFDDASDDDEEKTDPNGLSAKGQVRCFHP